MERIDIPSHRARPRLTAGTLKVGAFLAGVGLLSYLVPIGMRSMEEGSRVRRVTEQLSTDPAAAITLYDGYAEKHLFTDEHLIELRPKIENARKRIPIMQRQAQMRTFNEGFAGAIKAFDIDTAQGFIEKAKTLENFSPEQLVNMTKQLESVSTESVWYRRVTTATPEDRGPLVDGYLRHFPNGVHRTSVINQHMNDVYRMTTNTLKTRSLAKSIDALVVLATELERDWPEKPQTPEILSASQGLSTEIDAYLKIGSVEPLTDNQPGRPVRYSARDTTYDLKDEYLADRDDAFPVGSMGVTSEFRFDGGKEVCVQFPRGVWKRSWRDDCTAPNRGRYSINELVVIGISDDDRSRLSAVASDLRAAEKRYLGNK